MTLVSIVTPTYDRASLLVGRAWPSVLGQTHQDWEWLVMGDGARQPTVDAMSGISDPRVRFINLPRASYPEEPEAFWQSKGASAARAGVNFARGEWIIFLGDDDELEPNAIETLLAASWDADVIYGRAEVVHDRFGGRLGSYPPIEGNVVYAMWRRNLGFNIDPESWRRNKPADWDLWSRLIKAGTYWSFVPDVLYRYYPSDHVPAVDRPGFLPVAARGGGSPKLDDTPNYPRPDFGGCQSTNQSVVTLDRNGV